MSYAQGKWYWKGEDSMNGPMEFEQLLQDYKVGRLPAWGRVMGPGTDDKWLLPGSVPEIVATRTGPAEDGGPIGFPFWGVLALIVVCGITGAIGSGNNGIAMAAVIVFFPASFILYFAPAIAAYTRGHPSATSVAVVNLFLGWTVLGWIASLAWAYSGRQGGVQLVESVPSPTPLRGAPAGTVVEMKRCPYCAEDVRAEAIKCKHCGSDLTAAPPA